MQGFTGIENTLVLAFVFLSVSQVSKFPARTWAVTPESREALKPPSVEDQHEQRSVEFHPMVTCHLFRS